jgi:hypothetical protein
VIPYRFWKEDLTVIDFVTFGKGFIPCAHHRNRRVWVGGFCITHCCHSNDAHSSIATDSFWVNVFINEPWVVVLRSL